MTDSADAPESRQSPRIDTTVPHSARIWNYWLGGKDNYAVDRAAGDAYLKAFPQIIEVARHGRYFLARAVRYLAGEAGIRQFIDIGTGLPTVDNTHEVAQRVSPDSKIVYCDNDPLVLAHARALLTSTADGACDYVDADLRDPDTILTAAARTLDLREPVAVIMLGILGHIPDDDQAAGAVGRIRDAIAPGSYLVIADSIETGEAHIEAAEGYATTGAVPYHLRRREQIAHFFDGLDLVEPGLVAVTRWRPDPSPFDESPDLPTVGAVGRKPDPVAGQSAHR